MRLAVLGAHGMLGRRIPQIAMDRAIKVLPLNRRQLDITDLNDPGWRVLEGFEPDIVMNCAGVARAGTPDAAIDQWAMVRANTLGPHTVAMACGQMPAAKVIHVSTDCVFGGVRRGRAPAVPHDEYARTDPTDLYGRSKLAGEVSAPYVLNVRCSFVGWESGLLAWLTRQRGEIQGWARAHWSGLYVRAYARILVGLAELFNDDPALAGVLHVPGPQWRKLHLLEAVAERCELPVTVVPVSKPVVHRGLASRRWDQIPIEIPTWTEMLKEVEVDYRRLADRP